MTPILWKAFEEEDGEKLFLTSFPKKIVLIAARLFFFIASLHFAAWLL
jgi:hypothetical protein